MREELQTARQKKDAAFFIRRLDRVLAAMGSLYLAQDLITAVQEGRMHALVEGDSVVFVQIDQYPRQRVLHIVAAVGEMDAMEKGYGRLIDYAAQNNCGVIMGFGRQGWKPWMTRRGWKVKAKQFVYMLEN